jgi:Ni/Fe-hydrogenase subunit HybB-like protein
MATREASLRTIEPPEVLLGEHSYGEVSDRIIGIPLQRPGLGWLSGVGILLAFLLMMLTSIIWLLANGVGVWGIRIPVAWGFAIVNFVWWIGIGHAGTLISAILLLLRQEWRTSINRFAEAMTLFAVANAGMFPLLHLGRIWKFYYLLPYPDTMGIWPQWRSPLVWDVFAVMTYGTVSLIFWYVGLLPDLATMRDTARATWVRHIAGFFSLGWRGAAKHWQRHQMVYLLLAGLATPLVVSVHSIVSLDFSVSIVPGWHSTIFPPYFVAGAIFSGFAMVFTIAIPLRRAYGLHDLITDRHLDAMAKIMLVSGLIVDYGYIMEFFTAWFSADRYETYMAYNRVFGAYWPAFLIMMLGNVVATQCLWFRKVRRSPLALFFLSLLINAGMWSERYVIVIQSLHRDYMPSAWGMYHGTVWDWTLLIGSLGWFTLLVVLFAKFVPMISIYELRELLHIKGRLRRDEPAVPASQPEEQERPSEPVADAELYGVIAEYEHAEGLLEAARRTRAAGYAKVEAYTPYPVEGIEEALGLKPTKMPLLVLLGGILGGSGAYFMMAYSAVVSYPWNIGGRPLYSWPSFIPITFELTVLGGALVGVIAMIALNRLPQPYHPVFNAPSFLRASRDRFFLCVESADARFERNAVRRLLAESPALRVSEVPR